MSSETPLEEAKRKFAIQDVFLCDSKVWSSRTLGLGAHVADPSVQFKLDEGNECSVMEADGANDTKMYAVQYFIGTNVRLVAGKVHEKDPSEDKLVATIAATFLVRYLTDASPSQEMLQAFNDHAVHHIWPYWREYVESTTTRLRVPTVVIPLRVVGVPNITTQTGDEADAKS
jgi:hypothetical protein